MVPFVPVSVALVLVDVAVTPTGSMALISSRPPLRAQYRVRRMSRRFTPTTVTHAMHPLKYLRKIIQTMEKMRPPAKPHTAITSHALSRSSR